MVDQLLQNLIRHSYRMVPYYKRMFDDYGIDPLSIKTQEDLVKLPVLTKEQIQADTDSFMSSDYMYYPKNKDLIIKRTSGSTGKFMKIFWSKQDDIRSVFHLWQVRKRVYGIDPSSKFCSFHTTVYSNNKLREAPDIMLSRMGRNLSFSKLNLDKRRIAEYYEKMMEFRPEWFFMQPSLAYLFAEYISENGLEVPETLRYIELTGEYLFDSYRNKIEEVFGVKTVNQYGCNEANGLAIECPEGNLHCLVNNAIIEILKDGKRVKDGEKGEIHITCLTNSAMPFIRYALGDIGALHTAEKCACGSNQPIIRLVSGRVSEYVLLEDGEKLNSYIFLYPVEIVNSRMGNPIMQFQVVQTAVNKFDVFLALKKSFNGWKNTIIKEFIEASCSLGLKNAEWRFEFVDHILPNQSTGKLQFFKNEMSDRKVHIYA